MKIIEREHYLSKMKNVIGTPDIKIITGVRRSGKSKLLETFKDYISNNMNNVNIIHINFNLNEYDDLKNGDALYNYVDKNYESGFTNFVLTKNHKKSPTSTSEVDEL